ncbi:Hypothetical predicted protein, partial [Drosophila guanche]
MAANDERQEQVCCCCGCCCSGSTAAAVIALGNAASAPQPQPHLEVFQWIGLETAELLPAYVTRYYNSLHHQMATKRVNEANQDSFTVDHYCGGGGGGETQGPGSAAGGSGGAAGGCPGASAGAGGGGCASTAGQWSGGGGGVTASTGGCGIGMCQHHGLTSQSLMSGGSHISLLGSSGSSGMSGSGVGSSGQGIPQCSAAAADAAMMASGHCRSMSGLSSISMSAPPCPPPPALFNPCSSAMSLQQAAAAAASSRWGPRTSCPVHSPFRVRVPNGSICSGHQ